MGASYIILLYALLVWTMYIGGWGTLMVVVLPIWQSTLKN